MILVDSGWTSMYRFNAKMIGFSSSKKLPRGVVSPLPSPCEPRTSPKTFLEPILQFFDGNDPGTLGRVTRDGLTKVIVTAMLPEPEPTPFSTADTYKPQLIIWLLATVASGLSTKVKKLFAKAA
jgi:hypothetical protein